MANEFYDFFNQLFYSQEVWGYLGVIFTLIIGLVVCSKIREAAVIFVPIYSIMALDYAAKISVTGYFAWHFILMVLGAIMIPIYAYTRKG